MTGTKSSSTRKAASYLYGGNGTISEYVEIQSGASKLRTTLWEGRTNEYWPGIMSHSQTFMGPSQLADVNHALVYEYKTWFLPSYLTTIEVLSKTFYDWMFDLYTNSVWTSTVHEGRVTGGKASVTITWYDRSSEAYTITGRYNVATYFNDTVTQTGFTVNQTYFSTTVGTSATSYAATNSATVNYSYSQTYVYTSSYATGYEYKTTGIGTKTYSTKYG